MSMTEPVLSSLAGTNPPNPVLAVMSGNLELEPFNFSLDGDFLTKLLVTSGIELILLNMKFVFKLVVVSLTNPVGESPMPLLSLKFVLAVESPPDGPFITDIFLLFFTKTGELKLKIFPHSFRFSVSSITDSGAEKLYLAGGLVDLDLVTFTLTSGTTTTLVFDPLEQVELSWLGFTVVLDNSPFAPDFNFLGESRISFSSITLLIGLLLLFLSITSGALDGVSDNPLDVVEGSLVGAGAGVELKFKTGIESTFNCGMSDRAPKGEGGGSLLLISTLPLTASVTLVLTLKLDFAFDMLLVTGFDCSDILGGTVSELGTDGCGGGAAGVSDGARGQGCILVPVMLGL